jgi:NAD-dependent SIR2 family protein deacetylase
LRASLARPGGHGTGGCLPGLFRPRDAARRGLVRRDSPDLFAAIGTSGEVFPAAAYGQHARRMGAHTVELNLETSAAARDFEDHRQGPASEVVPAWVADLLD